MMLHNDICDHFSTVGGGSRGGRAEVRRFPVGDGSGEGAVPHNFFRILILKWLAAHVVHSGWYFM